MRTKVTYFQALMLRNKKFYYHERKNILKLKMFRFSQNIHVLKISLS